MIDTAALRESICKTFCGDLAVKTLPSGIAVTTTFRDAVSDPIACFIEQDDAGWYMADDGHFLSDTVARGIDIETGARKAFLDRILAPAGAWCDLTNLEIRTHTWEALPRPDDILQFITALVRARDVTFWSRERIKSTFKDDAYQALVERFAERADLSRSAPVDSSMQEFPADAVLRPRVQGGGGCADNGGVLRPGAGYDERGADAVDGGPGPAPVGHPGGRTGGGWDDQS